MSESIALFEKELRKKYGDDIMLSGENIRAENRRVVPVSPALDVILGGGITEGSLMMVCGPTGCGKTTMALKVATNAQKPEYGSRDVFYIDAECRLRKKNLEGINGLDISRVNVIRSSKEKNLSGEENLSIVTNILRKYEGCVVIIDSISSLIPSGEIVEDVSGSIRSSTPKIVASFCRQVAGVIANMNSIVISIHHLITNTSGYGKRMLVDGGVKIGYQADACLTCESTPKAWEKDGMRIGQVVEWKCQKSALSSPFGTCESYIRYGFGIDDTVEIVNLAAELGVIQKKGSWFYLPFVAEDCSFQGQQKVNDFINDNPQWIPVMVQKIMELS